MVSSRPSVSWTAGSRKTVGGDGVSNALNAGELSYRDERHLGPRTSPAQKLDGVGLHSVVSDFPLLHPASWVGILRGAFISLSSSQLCSVIGFLWFWLGDPSVPGSALSSHRLLLPIVFQGFWLGVTLIFSEFTLSSHILC
jgi:hypothetical protein